MSLLKFLFIPRIYKDALKVALESYYQSYINDKKRNKKS